MNCNCDNRFEEVMDNSCGCNDFDRDEDCGCGCGGDCFSVLSVPPRSPS